ncbi:acyl-CoA dehydrogenase family, member 10 [Plakobranchus ocellatus]|uniref:Acyl-CoA dehydrogenase family, member 10 n=1 Tax=Plakobranchus ocellatus TaxID=259542 RepID=A0AAV4D2M2_9GAST|nr:acyl-CoA dehydrogenase family, member 10 [Plakobranchus ocellatus]
MADTEWANDGKLNYEAVIFDMGGVFLPDPLQKFKDFEERMDLPPGSVSKVILEGWIKGPWEKIMIDEMAIPEFSNILCGHLSQNTGKLISPDTWTNFMSTYDNAKPYPEMITAIKCVRAHGLKTALLTNNCFVDEGKSETLMPLDRCLFDVVTESCVVGCRKPDPAAYTVCLQNLNVASNKVVFLDDQAKNVKAAQALGITAIQVRNCTQALSELSEVLGVPLDRLDPGMTPISPRTSFDMGVRETGL